MPAAGAAGGGARALAGLPEGYNWFLILAAVVVAGLVAAVNVYVLVHYMHPEDRNQAWAPKAVVVSGLSLAMLSVLMFPLDVANRAACAEHISRTSCSFSMPMEELWQAVYLLEVILIFAVIPFMGFLYEADSELTLPQRLKSSAAYSLVTLVVVGLVLGLAYGLAGFVEYEVDDLASQIAPLATQVVGSCLGGGQLCDGVRDEAATTSWKLRVSFPVYIIALVTIFGWLVFMVFAGIGLSSLPMDWIRQFLFRPKAVIPRSDYIRHARGLARRAKEIKQEAAALRREEQTLGKGRKWKRKLKELNKVCMELEEDEQDLLEVFPQGEDADTAWILTVVTYYAKLVLGALCVVVSLMLLIHVILYVFISPPVHPFLNEMFIALDKAFPLFGVAAFAFFCFYLIAITVKGCTKFGVNFVVFTVHPMQPGKTMMSSFMFNVGVILLASTSVVQFCSRAFALYAGDTAIERIFGNQIENLWGLRYLYVYNVFIICFFTMCVVSCGYLVLKSPPPRRRLTAQ